MLPRLHHLHSCNAVSQLANRISTIPLQAEQEVEIGEDAMQEDAPAPPARQQAPLQFMGKAYRGQSALPYRAAFQMAAPDQQTGDVMGNEAEDDHVSFAPVFEEEEQGTPAMFVPVVKGGAPQTGQHLVKGGKSVQHWIYKSDLVLFLFHAPGCCLRRLPL